VCVCVCGVWCVCVWCVCVCVCVSECCALKRLPVFDVRFFSTFQSGSLFSAAAHYVAELYNICGERHAGTVYSTLPTS